MPSTDTSPPRPLSRLTTPVVVILRALTRQDQCFGLQISRDTGLRTATIYGILARLERAGWVTSWPETAGAPGATADPGAPRRYYRLTPGGREMALAALKLREHLFA
jgi:DNA-binding PadR family transcriptional regulator